MKTFTIEKTGFYPWEKKILISNEKVSLWDDIFLAPVEILPGDLSYIYRGNLSYAREKDFFLTSEGKLLLFDRSLSVIMLFNLEEKPEEMLEDIWSVPVQVDEVLQLSGKTSIFRLKNGEIRVFNRVKNKFSAEEVPDITRNIFPDRPNVTLPVFPVSGPILQFVSPGKSSQWLMLIEKDKKSRTGEFFLVDESGENGHALFNAQFPPNITPRFYTNRDGTVIVFPGSQGLQVFSLREWNASETAKGASAKNGKFFGRFLETGFPFFGQGNAT